VWLLWLFSPCGLEPHDHPGKVFDLELPLEQGTSEGYQAIDERRTIKALLRP
jgi:hypothetical protein